MSHIFLFGGVKIGSNTAFHCFVLQRKLIYSIKYVVRRQNVFIQVVLIFIISSVSILICFQLSLPNAKLL